MRYITTTKIIIIICKILITMLYSNPECQNVLMSHESFPWSFHNEMFLLNAKLEETIKFMQLVSNIPSLLRL